MYADKKYGQLRIWLVTEGVKTTRSNRLKFVLGIANRMVLSLLFVH